MECLNHPGTSTDRTCYECGKPFCLACFSKVDRRFCLNCYRHLYGKRECETANQALIIAVIGLFCFGMVLEPLAFFVALAAKREIGEEPRLTGLGKARAALWIASIATGLYCYLLLVMLLSNS